MDVNARAKHDSMDRVGNNDRGARAEHILEFF